MSRVLLSTVFALAIGAASAAERLPPRQNDFTQFEFCYGNLEGSQTVLPWLKDQFDPATFEQVTKATDDFVDAFFDVETRLGTAILHPDKAEQRTEARISAVDAAGKPDPRLLVAQRPYACGLFRPV